MDNVRILVIDDNPIIPVLVKNVLTLWSEEDSCTYEIDAADNGVQGLEQVWNRHPDLIILDFHMPRLNGYEVLKALRSAGTATPIIAMTGTSPEGIASMFLTECDAYLPKPFEPSLLYHHIQEQLRRKEANAIAYR